MLLRIHLVTTYGISYGSWLIAHTFRRVILNQTTVYSNRIYYQFFRTRS